MADGGTPLARVKALGAATRREAAAAVAHARGLDAAGWDAPSWCEGWSVRDVLSHLTEGTERFHLQTRAALDGQAAPDFSPEERNARRAAVKAMPPAQLLAELERRNNAFWDDMESRADAALGTPVVPLGPGRRLSAAQVCELRLNEYVLHRWDTLAPQDPGATLDAASAALVLDYNLANAPRLARPDVLADLDGTFRCEVSGPGGGPVTLTCRGGQLTVTRDAAERANVTLRLPAEALSRLIWGRVTLDRALGDGTIQVDGDPATVHALGRVFGNR